MYASVGTAQVRPGKLENCVVGRRPFLDRNRVKQKLSDQLSPGERAKTQGANDFLLGLATAAASFGSGLMFASTSYTVIGIVGAVASLVPMALTGWWMARKRRLASV